MGFQNIFFEKEEQKLVKELTNKDVSWEEIARVRKKYHKDFCCNAEEFEKFRNEVKQLQKNR